MELSRLLESLQLETQLSGVSPKLPAVVPPAEQVFSQIMQLFETGGAQQAGNSTRAGLVRNLCMLFEAADCQWLFGSGCPKVLGDVVVALSDYAALAKQEADTGDPRSDAAYAAAADRTADVSLLFLSLLAKVEASKDAENLGIGAVRPFLGLVAGPIYIFAVTHGAEGPWSHPRTRSRAWELLNTLLQTVGCQSAAEFLRGQREEEEGWFAKVMQLLKPELKKETWKLSPATKYVFAWTLQQVTWPWLGPQLESVLPPSLLISDDYRVENKILGVQCLNHIILNVPAAELCQFNWAQVVYHALYNHLHTREAQLIQVVLPCLLDLLPVLERSPLQQRRKPRPPTPCDKVLQLVLTHMEAEHLLLLRRAYARNLPAFVERLGIRITRHLKRLERVIVGYLEVYDGPEETARLGILETLKCTIQHAWPRMACRLAVLLQALLRMVWDVAVDRSPTPEPVKAALLQGATECLILLDRCSEGQVKVLLEGVSHSCEDERVQECIRKVQAEPEPQLILPTA
uniref:TELO2 interacting protein 2 n=1 Tax=Sphenodon punctatus TaxID=8508 RepID=A0A8D0GYM5_SPHPU